MYHAYYDNEWKEEVIETDSTDVDNIAATLHNGSFYISYTDSDSLKFAKGSPGSWTSETIDSSAEFKFTSIAVDSSNGIHIAYYDNDDYELEYAVYTTSWSLETVNYTSDDVGSYPSIEVYNSKVYITYSDEDNFALKLSVGTYGNWSTGDLNASAAGPIDTLIIDEELKIAFINEDINNLELITYNTTTEAVSTETISNGTGAYVDSFANAVVRIDNDSSDVIHFIYLEEEAFGEAIYISWDESLLTWNEERISTDIEVGDQFIDIAIMNDFPQIIFIDDGYNIIHSTNESGAFIEEAVFSYEYIANSLDTATDSGKTYIAYSDSNDNLLLAIGENGNFTVHTVDDSSNDKTAFTMLVNDGTIHVAYRYYNGFKYDIYYAKGNPTDGFVTEQLYDGTTYGNAGKYIDMAFDSTGKIHLIFYQSLADELSYISGNYGSWSAASVIDDSVADIGEYASLAIDDSDTLHMVYHNDTNDDLMYATGTEGSFSTETVDSTDSVGGYADILIDGSTLHISYSSRTDGSIKYAYGTSGAFNVESINDSNSGTYYTNIMKIGDEINIIFFDEHSDSIKLSSGNTGNFTTTTLDDTATNGEVSATLDNDNKYHMSYKTNNTDLKYTTNQSSLIDSDDDGYSENTGDCNDGDSSISPDATEICGDNIDQDCDGSDTVCASSDDNSSEEGAVVSTTDNDTGTSSGDDNSEAEASGSSSDSSGGSGGGCSLSGGKTQPMGVFVLLLILPLILIRFSKIKNLYY